MAEAKANQPMDTGEQTSQLQSQGLGNTTISDAVVAKIASIAAREVEGVHALGGTTERAIGGAIQRITGSRGVQRTAGVDVEVGQEEAIVDLSMIVDYGQSIPDVTNAVRQNVMNQINSLTGLRAKEVNIIVSDLFFPQEAQQQQQQQESESRVA
ncbi:MAG TPA: Asp23/Gls24 family envelope stress response protein [Candidatus Aquicultor sp.]|jgi:uncharacterized alkaline shock family protein YloU